MRLDLSIISNWVTPGTHVLDLGCGDGTLLHALSEQRRVTGFGLEIDTDNLTACIKKGVNVIHRDLDKGLADFKTQSFDYVIMTQALQTVNTPHLLLDEILRIGKEGIITFPNFANWRARLYLATKGRMPVTKRLPKQWYDTDNIHFCTIKDFEVLCAEKSITILDRMVINAEKHANFLTHLLPNVLGEVALYRVGKPTQC